MITREFRNRSYRKSTFSGAGNDCVYVPSDGRLDAVADSKSGDVLRVDARALLALVRR